MSCRSPEEAWFSFINISGVVAECKQNMASVSDKPGIKTIKKEIIEKTAAVISDNKNSNLLLDILILNQVDMTNSVDLVDF